MTRGPSVAMVVVVVVVAVLLAAGPAALVVPAAPVAAQPANCDVTGTPGKFPVVLVHGFAGRTEALADDWRAVDPEARAAGADPVVFDYSDKAKEWVVGSGVDTRLKVAIECLAKESKTAGGPGTVAVVAHSMGGLATRAALEAGLEPALVAFVVTISTPHTGAFFDDGLRQKLELVAATVCGAVPALGASNPVGVLLAAFLCIQANSVNSGAAVAMTRGSREMSELDPLPPPMRVRMVAGDLTLCEHVLHWVGSCAPIADPLVTRDSAGGVGSGAEWSERKTVPVACTRSAVALVIELTVGLGSAGSCNHDAIRRHPTTLQVISDTIAEWKKATAGGFRHRVLREDVRRRTRADVDSAEAGSRLHRGEEVVVVCQEDGSSIPTIGGDMDLVADLELWNKLDDGSYVTDWALDTTKPPAPEPNNEHPGRDPAIPICPGTPPHRIPTLGDIVPVNGEGYGSVKPRTVYNGGSPAGMVVDITWESWGGPEAQGRGRALYVDGTVSVAEAPMEPAVIVASDLGPCGGEVRYRQVRWYFPGRGQSASEPGGQDICGE